MTLTLPCLSLRQPWAHLVVHRGKDIENRRWNTRHRGTFLIHAAKGMTRAEYDGAVAWSVETAGLDRLLSAPFWDQLERGGIIGAASIVDVIPPGPSSRKWHMKEQFGFDLRKVTPLPFRPLKGALGFFKVEITREEEQALRAAGLRLPRPGDP